MSWYGGSHTMPREAGPRPNFCSMPARFAMMLACVTTTPLGSLVEPEVYCSSAISLEVMSGGCHAWFSAARPAGATRSTSCSPADCRSAASGCIEASSHTTSRGAQLRMISTIFVRWRMPLSGVQGTATAPASRHAKKTEVYSSPTAQRISTRSRCKRRCCRAAARRFAWVTRVAYDHSRRWRSSWVTKR